MEKAGAESVIEDAEHRLETDVEGACLVALRDLVQAGANSAPFASGLLGINVVGGVIAGVVTGSVKERRAEQELVGPQAGLKKQMALVLLGDTMVFVSRSAKRLLDLLGEIAYSDISRVDVESKWTKRAVTIQLADKSQIRLYAPLGGDAQSFLDHLQTKVRQPGDATPQTAA